jgi:hypothetical protein
MSDILRKDIKSARAMAANSTVICTPRRQSSSGNRARVRRSRVDQDIRAIADEPLRALYCGGA